MGIFNRLFESREEKDVRLAAKQEAKERRQFDERIAREKREAMETALLAERLLQKAIATGDLAELERILKEKPALAESAVSGDGLVAFHYAAVFDQVEIASALHRWAPINSEDNKGATPLHKAAFFGSLAMTEWLLLQGADANWPDKLGLTPVHHLILGGGGRHSSSNDSLLRNWQEEKWKAASTKILSLLIEYGANINRSSALFGTPLNLARSQNQRELVKILLSRGAH
jgi:ankyrin repeat protein